MKLKFQNAMRDYQYILAFDLAKKLSGYSLLDFKQNKVLATGTIDTGNAASDELIWDYFYGKIQQTIKKCIDVIGEENKHKLFISKEQLPVQNGRFSTIATLQSLAQAHAIFDLAVYHTGVDVYDDNGVHSVAVKAYFRKLLDIQTPQKEDIANYIYNKYKDYDFTGLPFDVTDSIGVSLTLINRKWNEDIQSEISKIKKELKSAKAQNKITRLQDEIQKLQSLKFDTEND